MKKALIFILVISSFTCQAQIDYSWWNQIHHWDGITSWQNYMTISSAYLGPNALPVPENSKGIVDSSAQFEIGADLHFNKGDHTQDGFVRGFLPFNEYRFALSLEVIPIEFFQTDTIIRDMRASRGRSGKGKAGGDIYFTTYVQVLRDHANLPDISIRAALRTASGTNLGEARYTDGPGYYFDLSIGKNIKLKNDWSMRWYGMIGFYVYQTFDILHLQDDCLLYGGGIDLNYKNFFLSEELTGYSGYLKNGDKPQVFRSSLGWNGKKVLVKASLQNAIRDFPSERVRFSVAIKIPKWRG